MEYTPRRWERRGEYNLEIWEYQPPEPAVEGEEDAGDDGSGWLSVCTVHQPGEANARLIVTAPNILKALEEIMSEYPDMCADAGICADPNTLGKINRARAAIEAAK